MSNQPGQVIDQYKLTQSGQHQHSKLSVSCFRTFLFWVFVGNCAGFTIGKFLPMIKKDVPPKKMKRYQFIALNVGVLVFGWYGYKIAARQRKVGLQAILKEPGNVENVEMRIVDKQ